MEEKPDFGVTQRFMARHAPGVAMLRKYVTPATLGSAITGLAIAISWLVNAQHDIRTSQHDIQNLNEAVVDLQRQSEVLHKIDTQLAVTASKVDDIADEVDRQRQWRDKIEGIADTPPHARRRR